MSDSELTGELVTPESVAPVPMSAPDEGGTEYPTWRRRLNNTIIGLEVSPLNEFGRFGALGVAIATSRSNPLISAAVMGIVTGGFEVPAAVAAADALDHSETLQGSIERANNFTDGVKERFGIPAETRTSVPTKMGLAYFGGSAVSEINAHREDTSRTYEQNKRFGLKVAAALVGVSAVQGFLIARGFEEQSFDRLGMTALAIGGVLGAAKIFKSWIKRENRDHTVTDVKAEEA